MRLRYGHIALLTALALGACGTPAVHLRHPDTGQSVDCGPYPTLGLTAKLAAVEHERQCIRDYQRQGYERVPK